MRRLLASAAFALFASAAAATACDVALVLAHDVSHSVSRQEYALQTQGHAAAFRDPEIQALIRDIGGVSIMLVHWSGAHHQEIKIRWRRVRTPDETAALAEDLAAVRQTVEGFGTAIGDMLGFMRTVWTREISDCGRRIIDVSGDGEANEGAPIERNRAALIRAGVTVNGLAIARREIPLNRGIYAYYRTRVIGGLGAFALQADGFDDYARAFKRKLRRELSAPVVAEAVD